MSSVAEEARSAIDQDFGFGGRVARDSHRRLLNRDGSFNVERKGLPFFRSLNLYHLVLTVPWPRFYLFLASLYFLVNLAFAGAYYLCGPGALVGSSARLPVERFAESFFFSVQTLATIGYGHLSPSGLAANVLVSVEALVGLGGFALVTSLLFARFSRPEARVLFSGQAVVAPYQDGTGLMFRIANARSSQLLEVTVTVSLSRLESLDGRLVRRFRELSLERKRVVFFPLHWVVVHPIDAQSPLWGVDEAALRDSDAELLIYLTAFDETFSQNVHARSSYKFDEVVFGARFADLFQTRPDGVLAIDLRRLDRIERVLSPHRDG
jgi:inward rectifier potassium channel